MRCDSDRRPSAACCGPVASNAHRRTSCHTLGISSLHVKAKCRTSRHGSSSCLPVPLPAPSLVEMARPSLRRQFALVLGGCSELSQTIRLQLSIGPQPFRAPFPICRCPAHCLPNRSAATHVVAQPANGSRTISPSLELALMIRS